MAEEEVTDPATASTERPPTRRPCVALRIPSVHEKGAIDASRPDTDGDRRGGTGSPGRPAPRVRTGPGTGLQLHRSLGLVPERELVPGRGVASWVHRDRDPACLPNHQRAVPGHHQIRPG